MFRCLWEGWTMERRNINVRIIDLTILLCKVQVLFHHSSFPFPQFGGWVGPKLSKHLFSAFTSNYPRASIQSSFALLRQNLALTFMHPHHDVDDVEYVADIVEDHPAAGEHVVQLWEDGDGGGGGGGGGGSHFGKRLSSSQKTARPTTTMRL